MRVQLKLVGLSVRYGKPAMQSEGEGEVFKVVEGVKASRGRQGLHALDGVGESAQNKKANLEKWMKMHAVKVNLAIRKTSTYLASYL